MCIQFLVLAGGMGIGITVGRTLQHHKFLKDPTGAALQIWEDSGFVATHGNVTAVVTLIPSAGVTLLQMVQS